MPLREERSFAADSPVGAYWLRNSTGFRVVTPHRRRGFVDEVGVRERDGRVDVLAIRKRGLFGSHVTIVPAERVTVVRPWDQTLVLAPRRRVRTPRAELPAGPAPALPPAAAEAPVEQPPKAPRQPRVGPALRTAGAAGARGAGAAALAAGRVARAAEVLLLAFLRAAAAQLAVGARWAWRHAPAAGRAALQLAAAAAAVAAGLAQLVAAHTRAWRAELAEWRASRRWQESRPEPPPAAPAPSPNGNRAPARAAAPPAPPPSRRS